MIPLKTYSIHLPQMKIFFQKLDDRRRFLFPVAVLLLVANTNSFAQSAESTSAAPSDGEIYELSPFTVNTSNDRGYLSTNATSGTSLDTAVRDLPMALEVVNREFIEDLGALDMNEALRFSAGVETTQFSLGTGGSNTAEFSDSSPSSSAKSGQNVLTIRGYRSPNQQRLGFRIGMLLPVYGIVVGGQTNTVNQERMEIVRGPNSLLYGVNMLTGVVNLIPRMPLSEPRTEIGMTVGSYGLFQSTLDNTGPLIKESKWGSLNYRLMLSYQENETDKQFYENKDTYVAGQLDYWSPNRKFNLFLEFQKDAKRENGIGDRWWQAQTDQYFRNEYGEPIIWTRNFDEGSPDYQRVVEADRKRYSATDLGYFQNLSGPDTYRDTDEENLLAIAKWNPIDGLHIEAGVYHTKNEVETRDLSLYGGRNDLNGSPTPYFGIDSAEGFPEYDPDDYLTRETAAQIRLNGDPLRDALLDQAFNPAAGTDDLSHGGFGYADIITFESPGDSSRYDPTANSAAEIYRYMNGYMWYKWPQSSESTQARARIAYEFDSEFLNSNHTIVVGYNYIKDEIEFVTSPKLAVPEIQEAWGDWDGVAKNPTNPRFQDDGVYYRDSVFNPNPVRFTSDTNYAISGAPSKDRLGDGTVDEQGNVRQINWVTRSGFKEATLEFNSYNFIYQGKFWNDRLLIFGGVRHDEYSSKESEKLRVVDWSGATGLAPGKPFTADGPLTTHLIGNGSGIYSPIPALDIPTDASGSMTINDAVASDIATIQELYPNGTFESQPTQKFNTPSYGVSFRIIDPLTVYFTHSEGIFPNSGQRDGNYEEIDAEHSYSDEIGLKFDLMDGRISGTISYFNIKRENATYRLGVAPNPAGWFGGPRHGGDPNTMAFDPKVFAGVNGVPADAVAERASYPTKWDQTIIYEGRRPPDTVSRIPVIATGLSSVNLEPALEKFGLTLSDIASDRHPETGEKFTNAPSGFLANYNLGGNDKGGDFYNTRVSFVYLFDLEVIEAAPHPDPAIENLRNAVRAAFEEAYSGQDERLPNSVITTGTINRIGDIYTPTQYDGLTTISSMNAPYVTYEEEGKGFDGQIILSPTDQYQIIFNFSHVEREIVGKGFNMVRPIDEFGNDWATGWDGWNWAFGRQNFTDPKDPTTFTGEGVNGIDISFVPQDSAALWNKYQFTDGFLENLEIFGGVTWRGEAETSTPLGGANLRANYFRTPPTKERYEVAAGLAYRFLWKEIDWRIRLNITNLLDDTYDSTVITYNETDPLSGEAFTERRRWERYYPGRSFRVSVNANF
jgi:outer membrane receptor for ferric coprogen and ferric-rhodotorulic acid